MIDQDLEFSPYSSVSQTLKTNVPHEHKHLSLHIAKGLQVRIMVSPMLFVPVNILLTFLFYELQKEVFFCIFKYKNYTDSCLLKLHLSPPSPQGDSDRPLEGSLTPHCIESD